MRSKDYKNSQSEYLRNVWELNTNRRDIDPGWLISEDKYERYPANCSLDRIWGNLTDMIPDYHELSIFTYQEICEAGGIELKPPSALGRECMRAAKWLSKLLRHVGNKHCEPQGRYRFDDSAYGLPLDSGCWFLWKHILEVGKEAIPQHGLPSKRSFCVFDACALASFGDRDKARFQFAVLLSALRHKRPKSRYERYVEVCGMRAMSGHIGNPWTKTPRYATRIKPGDEKWMSVLSRNTTLTNLDSIFTTGLVLWGGGTRRTPTTSRVRLHADLQHLILAWVRWPAIIMLCS